MNTLVTIKINVAETFYVLPWKLRLKDKTKQDKNLTTSRQF